jgi:hypothetical protein
MDPFAERAIPSYLINFKPKIVAPGITQETLEWINANTIPAPTPAGQEIQFFLSQLPRTYLDTQSTFLSLQCSLTMTNKSGRTIFSNGANGCVIGSFYSLFYRYAVWANTSQPLDDIQELGLVAHHYLRLTMARGAKATMSYLMGFTHDYLNCASLTGYRLKGQFPECAVGDATAFQSRSALAQDGRTDTVQEAGINTGQEVRYQFGAGVATDGVVTQNFEVSLPLLGALGITNDNPYYMGLGQTRVSYFLDDPQNAFLLTPAYLRYAATVDDSNSTTPPDGGAAITTTATNVQIGGFTYGSFTISRARIIGNVITLSEELWEQMLPSIQANQGRLVSRVTTFLMSAATIPSGSNGTIQIPANLRAGSLKYVSCHFNPNGALPPTYTKYGRLQGTDTGVNIELPNYFKKYGSINPGLTQGTAMSINNTWYPKLGLDPTNLPGQTLSYIMDCLNMLNSGNMKPSFSLANWLVIDPNAVQPNGKWRSGVITTQPQRIGTSASATSQSTWFLNTLVSPSETNWWDLGLSKETFSNDFFLFFNFESAMRPGMVAGRNTYDGQNILNLNLGQSCAYNYNVQLFAAIDAVLVHVVPTGEVLWIK